MKKLIPLVLVAMLAFFNIVQAAGIEKEVTLLTMADVDFTKPSLANPHVVRIGEAAARGGRFAVLERVYDVGAVEKLKAADLAKADTLFKKGAVKSKDVVNLMTAEKAMFAAGKFKQRIRVWEVSNPGKSVTINVPPVFDEESPQVIEPIWILRENDVIVAQEKADHSGQKFYIADFKKKLLKKSKADDFPVMDYESYTDGKDQVTLEYLQFDGDNDDIYRVGKYSINHGNGTTSVLRYALDDYTLDENGEDTGTLNPLILEMGTAGFYVSGYTSGHFLVQQGMTPTTNIMDNQMPEDWEDLASVKAALTGKWAGVGALDFATYQVLGYKVK